MKKKLYIGCAITNLSEEKREAFFDMISDIKNKLKDHFEIMEFLGVDDLATDKPFSPLEIYEHGITKCVMEADCMLAMCDYPSLGLGYEIGTAVEKRGIPVLAMAREGSLITRLILGVNHKSFIFAYYNSADDIVQKTLETLTK
ncbi:MAG TPA: hypothetical protein VGO63_04255 [Candidatus Paceibacterota bacterium]|jgi:hypothetical protein|nr:hypothetical protein [Candidatus Paceibacterota bacterium]